jgi:UDPglucose 6-dehydrogenase
MSTIGIIGHGFVGKAVAYGFAGHDKENGREPKHKIYIYDKFKKMDEMDTVLDKSEIIFLCLPTPFFEDSLKIDLSLIDKTLEEICPKIIGKGKVLVIKSTVTPGTTKRYAEKYPGVPFAFNPEFLTESNYLQDFINSERIVIGAENNWIGQKIIGLYRTCFPSTHILRMSSSAAEIVKYQCNVMLATKVAVSNIFYDICEAEGVNYTDVKQAVALDSRIGESHLDVTTERGFGGKCFPKDLGAIIGRCRELSVDCVLLEEVNNYNLRIRKVKDWKEIAGASVGGRKYSED